MQICTVGKWHRSEHGKGCYEHHIISFSIKGLEYLKVEGIELTNPGPIIFIIPEGMEFEFCYNVQRDNRAIVFKDDCLSAGQPGFAKLNFDPLMTEIPLCLEIESQYVSGWEVDFVRMTDAFNQGTAADLIRCQMGIYDILRYFLDRRPDTYYSSPAVKLRKLIDNDQKCEKSLEQLSSECGYSSDHLRVIFRQNYGSSPLEYRNRHRMTLAMQLISNSNLSIKEISTKLGFKYNTHFCVQFKQTFNITASQAIKRFRQFNAISGHLA